MELKRIVITGTGVISPVGNTTADFWQNLLAGKSGLGQITGFDTEGHRCTIAGEVKDFEPAQYMEPAAAKKIDRFCQFAIAASNEAVEEAGLKDSSVPAERIGVLIGSGIGGLATLEEEVEKLVTKGPRRVSPMLIPKMIGDMSSGIVSIHHGFKGPNFTAVSACALNSLHRRSFLDSPAR